MTEENKKQINQIVRDHLNEIDIMRVVEVPLEVKANRIYQEFSPIFRKLDDKKLLPEGCNWNVFHQFVTQILEHVANSMLRMRSFVI